MRFHTVSQGCTVHMVAKITDGKNKSDWSR